MPDTPPRQVIAAFDFDGTLTMRDTFLMFLMWKRKPAAFAVDLAVTLPLLVKYALGRAENDAHKMALFARQFTGFPVAEFEALAAEFSTVEVPKLISGQAFDRMRFHQESGHTVAIVSASIDSWIRPWAEQQGVEVVLASSVETSEGALTGRLAGKNCHGNEKLRRLLAAFPERSTYELFAYGDASGDRALLNAADHSFYRKFE
jgi:HAD superfamily hydrolase (TIGR01490 family)